MESKTHYGNEPKGRSLGRDEIFELSIMYTIGLGLTMLSGCIVDDDFERKDNDANHNGGLKQPVPKAHKIGFVDQLFGRGDLQGVSAFSAM